ncbi:TPA: helix-turn-helix domain-containing protein [Vibrio parahaemolyticus]|nr:helix-turn-helix domain-containing protein [Vibrio parahaemolyticus]
MRFQDWIKSKGFGGQTWLAQMIGVSPKTVNEWVHFRRSPKPQSRNKIRRISGGKVDFSLFDLEYEQAQAERAA